jgi:hypothetical protein
MFNNFFQKSCRLWDNVEKHGTAGQATGGNIIRRMRVACRLNKTTYLHSRNVVGLRVQQRRDFILV